MVDANFEEIFNYLMEERIKLLRYGDITKNYKYTDDDYFRARAEVRQMKKDGTYYKEI